MACPLSATNTVFLKTNPLSASHKNTHGNSAANSYKRLRASIPSTYKTTFKMKKSILILLPVLLLANAARAQVAVKAGFNIASISEKNDNISRDDIENRSIIGPVLGIALGFRFGDILVFQPELLYSQSGGRNTYNILGGTTKTTYRINYLELPLLAKLQLGNRSGEGFGFHIAAGPWLGYALNGKSKVVVTVGGSTIIEESDYNFDDEDDAKRINYGLIGAAGLSFNSLIFDLRYNYGLNNLLDEDADNNNDNNPVLQTRGVALTLGYRF